jgi:hypothetical protein
MPLADWLDDFFKDFIHYVADSPFESLEFFRRRVFFNSPNGVIHLVVNIEEPLNDVFCDFRILEHSFLPETRVWSRLNNSATDRLARYTGN